MVSFTIKWMLEVAHINGHLVLVIQMIGLLAGVGDFNGNHYDDILWRHNNGETAIWINRYEGYYRHWPEGAPGLDWQIAGVADFNGDRRSDILWRNTDGTLAVWLMNGNLHTDDYSLGPTQDWKIQKTGDFNGDKYADILWRNTDGTLAIWFMYGGYDFGQAYPGIVDNYWGVTSVANFGKSPGLRGESLIEPTRYYGLSLNVLHVHFIHWTLCCLLI